jgi:hypothetical protein
MLVEYTLEHREIFRPGGECVGYFGDADQTTDAPARLSPTLLNASGWLTQYLSRSVRGAIPIVIGFRQ